MEAKLPRWSVLEVGEPGDFTRNGIKKNRGLVLWKGPCLDSRWHFLPVFSITALHVRCLLLLPLPATLRMLLCIFRLAILLLLSLLDIVSVLFGFSFEVITGLKLVY